jgi:AraC-like DNA-binding protein
VSVLLPTPSATLVHTAIGHVELYGPHDGVWMLDTPRLIFDVPSDILKILFGTVADFVNRMFGEAEHSFLQIFAQSPSRECWLALLREAEEAVTITDDQLQFRRWQAQPGVIDRQIERLCQRYAGQPPQRMLKQLRFSAEFIANLSHDAYQPQGGFTDQSHYIRACRELTGYTPTALKNLSDLFYLRGDVFPRIRC